MVLEYHNSKNGLDISETEGQNSDKGMIYYDIIYDIII